MEARMTIICYPKCTTCKKAVAFLQKHGLDYIFRDIQKERPDAQELRQFWQLSGLELKKFFNTSGQLYRSLKVKESLPGMSEEDMLDLLASDGMIVKRPLLVLKDKVLVGFNEKEWETHL